ncbi:related to tRNA splicing endonuclease [Ramularia collo-cygni]|uniref:tRNA-splicing endonuclease subunit Sen34 n=1 Tax=Ramularia collo-cygni TaxID=112498 RepID=A0A2D3VFX9_9PEZI|nr:related to tRNA splicing endonuclease [Ramularia collo-cygni]CZT24102.1 related to tRNA splicing endonuclease [Ramularia collo-cygni]
MADSSLSAAVHEPIPIFKVAHHYMLYDVNVVTHLRKEHNISGVLMGTLPQASQQNVFLGLPLELMPEEARLLVEKNVAYIVDDVAEHKRTFLGNGLGTEERKAYQAALRKQGVGAAQEHAKKADERKKIGLQKAGKSGDWNDIPEDMFEPSRGRKGKPSTRRPDPAQIVKAPLPSGSGNDDESLFGPPANGPPIRTAISRTSSRGSPAGPEPYGVTPTTSQPPMQVQKPASGSNIELPVVPNSYPVYKHLHEIGYFMAPGLRFGCQYMAYPGDPLRFHSHFLCNGMDWEEEFDLLDLVGGGRLGTGVKKGFMVGGEEPVVGQSEGKEGNVRVFCVEWGGM